jgi:hypothetical protein
VFWLTIGVYVATNVVYIVWGSSEEAEWNRPKTKPASKSISFKNPAYHAVNGNPGNHVMDGRDQEEGTLLPPTPGPVTITPFDDHDDEDVEGTASVASTPSDPIGIDFKDDEDAPFVEVC